MVFTNLFIVYKIEIWKYIYLIMEYPIFITVWTWMRAHELVPGTPVGGGAGARVTGSSNRERGIGLDSDDIYSPI